MAQGQTGQRADTRPSRGTVCRLQGGAGPACSVFPDKQGGPGAALACPDAGQTQAELSRCCPEHDTLTCAPAALDGNGSPPQQQAGAGLDAPAYPHCPPAGLDSHSGCDRHQALLHIALAMLTGASRKIHSFSWQGRSCCIPLDQQMAFCPCRKAGATAVSEAVKASRSQDAPPAKAEV